MIITYAIIGFTCLVSYLCWNNPESFTKLAHIPTRVEHQGEYYRLFSAGFVHADSMHLIFNMFSLYSFGSLAEQIFMSEYMFGERIGGTMFLVFYVSAIVAANAPAFIKNKENYNYIGVGASGAVSAVIYACILFVPTAKLYIFFAIPMPAWLFGFLYLAYESYANKNINDNIAHDVHFAGAIYGILFVAAKNFDVLLSFMEQVEHSITTGSIF
jgi:membrane associated rhomboid family serine protease